MEEAGEKPASAIFRKKNSKKFCFQKKLLTFAARFGRNDKFIDLLERENEVKKLKAIDSLLIEKRVFPIN